MVNSKLFFEKKNKLAFLSLSVLVLTLNEDFTMAPDLKREGLKALRSYIIS